MLTKTSKLQTYLDNGLVWWCLLWVVTFKCIVTTGSSNFKWVNVFMWQNRFLEHDKSQKHRQVTTLGVTELDLRVLQALPHKHKVCIQHQRDPLERSSKHSSGPCWDSGATRFLLDAAVFLLWQVTHRNKNRTWPSCCIGAGLFFLKTFPNLDNRSTFNVHHPKKGLYSDCQKTF